MSDVVASSDVAPVTDRRPVPRGVLPRGMQTWLMVAIAMGMLAAWSMRDVLGRRQGREDESDLLGVLAIAALLVLLPLASEEAGGVAGLVGGAIGIVLGLLLARLPER